MTAKNRYRIRRAVRAVRSVAVSLCVLSGLSAALLVESSAPASATAGYPLAFVADGGTNSLVEISPNGGQVVASIPVGTDPYALAVSPDATTVFVVDRGSDSVTPVAVSSGTAGTAIPVGSSPEAIAVAPDGSLALVANTGDGTVTPIRLDHGSATALSPVTVGTSLSKPSAIAITPDGTTAFVADYGTGRVVPIDLATLQVGSPITVGNAPQALAVTPDGSTLYVANYGDATVTPVDVQSRTAGTAISVGPAPDAIAIAPDGLTAYVDNTGSGTVTPLLVGSQTAVAGAPFNVGNLPTGVAFAPDGATAYVTNFSDGTLTPVAVSTGSGTSQPAITLPSGSPGLGSPPPDPNAVAFLPDQGPTAVLTAPPAHAGTPVQLDAAASLPGSTPIVSYAWVFGDGTTAATTTPVVSHTYPTAGEYQASVTVTDADGVSTSPIFTGQSASGNGSAAALATLAVPVQAAPVGATPVAYVADYESGRLTPVSIAATASGPPVDFGSASQPTAVAVTPDGREVVVADKAANALRIVSTQFDTNLGLVPAGGSEPAAVAITPDGSTAYVADAGSGVVASVNLASDAVSTIAVQTDPQAVAVTPDGSLVYVANTGSGTVSVISTATGTVVGTLSVGSPRSQPSALAVTPNGRTVYVADAGTGEVVPITVAPLGGSVGTPIPVGLDPTALAMSPSGALVVAANSGAGSLTPIGISGPAPLVGSATTVGGRPDALAFVPDGSTLLAANSAGAAVDTLTVSLGANGAPELTSAGSIGLDPGDGPSAIAVVPDQHPVAALTVSPGYAGAQTLLDASASLDPSSPIATYAWSFGDGQRETTSTPTTFHSYASAGNYQASVTETDTAGVSTTVVFTGQTVSGNGGPGARATASFLVQAPPSNGPPIVTAVTPVSGPVAGGNEVTISGSNLTGVSSVDFGTRVATIDSIGPASLVVSVPSGAPGTVDVVLHNAFGPSAVSAIDRYRYEAVPLITRMLPDTGPVAGGTRVTLIGTGLGTVSTVKFGSRLAAIVSESPTAVLVTAPPGSPGVVAVAATSPGGTSARSLATAFTYLRPVSGPGGCQSFLTHPVVAMAPSYDGAGYVVVNASGSVAVFGDSICYGSLTGRSTHGAITGVSLDAATGGYWIVSASGTVSGFDAHGYGSVASGILGRGERVVTIAGTPSGHGYLLVTNLGRVLAFGDAHSHGSLVKTRLAAPVTAIALTVDGKGYDLLGANGAVHNFGDASFHGSLVKHPPSAPAVGVTFDERTGGYWVATANGHVYGFDAPFKGSAAKLQLAGPIVGITSVPGGGGYRLVAGDGGLFCFGAARFYGSPETR